MKAHDPAIRAEAFDWHQRIELGRGVAVTLVPMRHWSARGLTDRNKALWAAFVIETPAGRIYHVAIQAMATAITFARRATATARSALAVLPIGAYEPRWFMGDQHMNPAESVKAFLDSGAELALGHHYGTFQLTDEPFDAPEQALVKARVEAGIEPERFRLLRAGQVWEIEAQCATV